MKSTEIQRCVRELSGWAFCDSSVQLDQRELYDYLALDYETSGYLPTDEQCMLFITGGDEGTPPADLVRDFPKTNAFIERYWE